MAILKKTAGDKTRGATALTYGLVVGLVAIGSLGAVTSVGDSVVTLFSGVSDTMTSGGEFTLDLSGATPTAMDVDDSGTGPTLTVTVNGKSLVESGPLSVSLSDETNFSLVSDTCSGKGLSTGKSCTVRVQSQAVSDGAFSATLRIANDKHAQTVSLSGTASGLFLYAFSSHTFTTCGQSGRTGPSLSSCRSAYSTDWDGNSAYFDQGDHQGKQLWTVPRTGTYRIEAYGAQGSTNNRSAAGRPGAYVRGDIALTQGEKLEILVGQRGSTSDSSFDHHGNENGGGGGSFVVRKTGNTLLIAAGGGGGGYSTSHGGNCGRSSSYGNGQASNNGYTISCYWTGSGGTNGNGGYGYTQYGGHGGAGYSGNATGNGSAHCSFGSYAQSYTSGGVGADGTGCYGHENDGGFGGGGQGDLAAPGGGGGYSGGGAAGNWSSYSTYGGGGGSYYDGSMTNTTWSAGSGSTGGTNGHGRVIVTFQSP